MSEARRPVLEALAVWALATAACSGLYWIGQAGVGIIRDHLPELVAIIFWGLPTLILDRRRADLRTYGWSATPIWRHLAWALGASAVIFPLFVVGFAVWHHALGRIGHAPIRWPDPWFLPTQLIVVAIPEEFFFRGFLLTRIKQVWPDGLKVFGVTIGPAVLLTSLLFALGHYLVDFVPGRLAVFFPALAFAWLRERTGSIAAGAMFHTLCNFVENVLFRSLT